jgi:hypothetical protein
VDPEHHVQRVGRWAGLRQLRHEIRATLTHISLASFTVTLFRFNLGSVGCNEMRIRALRILISFKVPSRHSRQSGQSTTQVSSSGIEVQGVTVTPFCVRGYLLHFPLWSVVALNEYTINFSILLHYFITTVEQFTCNNIGTWRWPLWDRNMSCSSGRGAWNRRGETRKPHRELHWRLPLCTHIKSLGELHRLGYNAV